MNASELSTASGFFVLSAPASGNYDTDFYSVGDNVGDARRCPRCNDVIGSLVWLPPFRGELDLVGREFGDLVRTPGDELLLTERMAEAFQKEGLKGLSGFHPVEIIRIRKRGRLSKALAPPKYLCVVPAFLSAAVDEARSRIQRAGPISCDWCRSTGMRSTYGFAIDRESWNDDDVFRPRGSTGKLVVSERFERWVVRHGFTSMELTPTEKFILDFYPLRPPPSTPKASA